MLCAACVWMFQESSKEGIHHHSYQNLLRAAELGCKICLYLQRVREEEGLDEVREREMPFTRYKFESFSKSCILVMIKSTASWLSSGGCLDLHVSEPGSAPLWWPKYVESIQRDQKAKPWMVRKGSFVMRRVAENTGDPSVMELGRHWLDTCLNQHEQCEVIDETRKASYYPIRLIDVGISNAEALRLISTKEEAPISGNRYATLSHCWGKDPSFLRLTATNMALLMHEIPSGSLPKSFADAITSCRRLGLRYLWIDSLCILQSGPGSVEDWQIHVGEMHVIYGNCVVNLSIAHASNPREGAFVDRNEAFTQTAHVYAPINMGLHSTSANLTDGATGDNITHGDGGRTNETIGSLGSSCSEHDNAAQSRNEGRVCLVTIFTLQYDYSSYLSTQPLYQRGWVFQERLMTPRMLAFGRDRIYWWCHEQVLNEYLPFGLPNSGKMFDQHRKATFTLPSSVLRSDLEPCPTGGVLSKIHDEWYEVVGQYSATDLTYPEKDKLPAIAAIASRFDRVLPGKYYAGLFSSGIPIGLLWYQNFTADLDLAEHKLHLRIDRDRTGYQAPTWSWASVNGRLGFVRLQPDRKSREDRNILANVERISVDLTNPHNPLGQVITGELVISGILIHLTSDILANIAYPSHVAESRRVHLGEELFGLCVMEEIREWATDSDKDTFSVVHGILLCQVEQDTYQRIGYFETGEQLYKNRFQTQDYDRKTIRII